jgi:hypothetical protein
MVRPRLGFVYPSLRLVCSGLGLLRPGLCTLGPRLGPLSAGFRLFHPDLSLLNECAAGGHLEGLNPGLIFNTDGRLIYFWRWQVF